MTTSVLKRKLTRAINDIDDPEFLQALHTIVQSKNEEIIYHLTPSQKKELDRRRSNHISGKSKSYTWEEVKRAALRKKV